MEVGVRQVRRLLFGALLPLAGLACGETSRKQPAQPPSGAGEGGLGDGGGAPTVPEGGAAAGDAGGAPTGGAQPGGAGGEGGAFSEPLPGYSLTLIPHLPKTMDVQNTVLPDDVVSFSVSPLAMSADGTLLIGSSQTRFNRPNGVFIYARDEVFSWTAETGTQLIPIPGTRLPGVCVADDGSAAIFSQSQASSGFFLNYHWTPGLDLLLLPAETGEPAGPTSCNAAANLASYSGFGPVSSLGYFWQLGMNANAIVEVELPSPDQNGSQLLLSRDGTRGLLNTSIFDPPNFAKDAAYAWTAEEGPSSLGTPDGQNCRANVISGDGNVIAGTCVADNKAYAFRSTSGVFTALEQGAAPLLISRDGRTIWGAAHDPQQYELEFLVSWTEGEPMLLSDLETGGSSSLLGATDEGSVAYVNVGRPDLPHQAGRWTPDGKVTALPSLPGFEHTFVNGFSADGVLAIGDVSNARDFPNAGKGVAVLWDAQGARDVLTELKAAQVDLQGAQSLTLQRVWSGPTIRMQGYYSLDPNHSQVFFAELPNR